MGGCCLRFILCCTMRRASSSPSCASFPFLSPPIFMPVARHSSSPARLPCQAFGPHCVHPLVQPSRSYQLCFRLHVQPSRQPIEAPRRSTTATLRIARRNDGGLYVLFTFRPRAPVLECPGEPATVNLVCVRMSNLPEIINNSDCVCVAKPPPDNSFKASKHVNSLPLPRPCARQEETTQAAMCFLR